ncbi:MAG: aminopeptidase P family protein [Coriobacteriales bacterium]|nr:aminopeptidase P family protein [Coriobacteriales bacterium]
MHNTRFQKVFDNMEALALEQLLVTDPASIGWLTGFSVDPGERFMGLVLRLGQEPVLIINDLFPTPEDLGIKLMGYRDTNDPVDIVQELLDAQKPLGCDKNMAARFLIPLQERKAASQFVLGSKAVDDARSIKEPFEIELMRKASAINDQAMEWLTTQVYEGVTEAEIAHNLLEEYKRLGAQGFSFAPIISFGAHAADPHHEPDNTQLQAGDVVLFDVGCLYNGYCSDMTRTFFFKSVTPEQQQVYEIVRKANWAAAQKVAPGVLFSEIDAAARSIICDAGYGHEFNHRLGHQIGTNVHEPGDVSAIHHEPVQPGMIFSDEPGIYLAGNFGVRIEDLILVTENGCEVLNNYPRELRVLE